jgi:type II secretory pathway component PulL
MQRWNVLRNQLPDIVLTSEELRVTALTVSAKRGKWVAKRRVFRRWLGWLTWSYLLPVIGLVTVISVLLGFVFWKYSGQDMAYVSVQKWVQQEFGNFQTNANNLSCTQASRPDNTGMITLTNEATPDLQIDHHLTIKTKP